MNNVYFNKLNDFAFWLLVRIIRLSYAVITPWMIMSFKNELNEILEARKSDHTLSMPILLSIVLGVVAEFTIPILAPVFGVLAFALFYKRRIAIARMPCPRCKNPFGTKSNIILAVGTFECETCKLSIYAEEL